MLIIKHTSTRPMKKLHKIHSSQIALFPIMGKIEMGIKKLKNIRNFVQYLERFKIK